MNRHILERFYMQFTWLVGKELAGEFLEFVHDENQRLLEQVRTEVIGEDEHPTPRQPGDEVINQTLRNHKAFSKDELRAEQRAKLGKLINDI